MSKLAWLPALAIVLTACDGGGGGTAGSGNASAGALGGANAPVVQPVWLAVPVIGVAPIILNGNIIATDPQNLPLNYSISKNGASGTATINPSTGAFSYTVAGNATANGDSVSIQVSNGSNYSVTNIFVTLQTDPLLRNQWHLQNLGFSAFSSLLPTPGNDLNVAGAWGMGYSGKGIKVAVIDTGLEIAHEDLVANVDAVNSRNFVNGTNDPTPGVAGHDHGTQVAGIIGATGFNGIGGRGVAYEATLRGYNLLASQSLVNLGNSLGLASYSSDIDVFNESFGASPTNLDPVTDIYSVIDANVLTLRGGKGGILIQSAGNEFNSFKDDTTVCYNANNYGVSCGDPATDTRRTSTLPIIVGALNSDGVKSSYSTTGSSIWVAAPGGEFGFDAAYVPQTSSWFQSLATLVQPYFYKPAITTTAFTGCQNAANDTSKVNALDAQGNNAFAKQCQYTALMNGTSSAAPNLSGVVALMLQANPNLGYRDVKYILAKTAKKVDANNKGVTATTLLSGSSTPVVLEQGWVRNAAGNWFSNFYGFGAVDATAAVSMAKSYIAYLPPERSSSSAMHFTADVAVPNNSATGTTLPFSMSPSFSTVEQVNVVVNLSSSPSLSCNQIELASPAGTKSILMHAANGFSTSGVMQTSIPGTRFLSNAFYGESAGGNWTLRFLDVCNSATRTTLLSADTQTLTIKGH